MQNQASNSSSLRLNELEWFLVSRSVPTTPVWAEEAQTRACCCGDYLFRGMVKEGLKQSEGEKVGRRTDQTYSERVRARRLVDDGSRP